MKDRLPHDNVDGSRGHIHVVGIRRSDGVSARRDARPRRHVDRAHGTRGRTQKNIWAVKHRLAAAAKSGDGESGCRLPVGASYCDDSPRLKPGGVVT